MTTQTIAVNIFYVLQYKILKIMYSLKTFSELLKLELKYEFVIEEKTNESRIMLGNQYRLVICFSEILRYICQRNEKKYSAVGYL